MENANRIYLANLKASEKFNDDLLEGALCVTDLEAILEQWAYQPKNSEKRYINIKVVKRQKPSDYDKTHYIEVDQFIPDPSKRSTDSSEEDAGSK